jgi:hypothetical protein
MYMPYHQNRTVMPSFVQLGGKKENLDTANMN